MLPTSGILSAFAICLAGFDEILTLQWGASRTGRPFHLGDLSTPEEERSLIQSLVQIRTPIRLMLRQLPGKRGNRTCGFFKFPIRRLRDFKTVQD
jgi:hypothetical protein